jgi:hypothetical protein
MSVFWVKYEKGSDSINYSICKEKGPCASTVPFCRTLYKVFPLYNIRSRIGPKICVF